MTRPATAPTPLILVSDAANLRAAWRWLVSHLPSRPPPNGIFTYNDLAGWLDATGRRLLYAGRGALAHASSLYLASQLVNPSRILDFINKVASSPSVAIPALDDDVRRVIASEARFRAALSEHLAFWIQAASSPARQSRTRSLALLPPNAQPEDKGPDGLCLECGTPPRAEVISVKNSIKNPKPLIRSASFESRKLPKSRRQLDDFYQLKEKNLGLNRLQQGLSRLTDYLQINYQERLRMGLLLRAGLNAVIVADHQHAQQSHFSAYRHIRGTPADRIATYIGAKCWKTFAKRTREETIHRLQAAGVW